MTLSVELENPLRISYLYQYLRSIKLTWLIQAHTRYDYKQLDDAKRQSLIAHSWEIIVSLPNTSGMVSVSESWGSRVSSTHMVSSSWDTNNSGFDERLNKEVT